MSKYMIDRPLEISGGLESRVILPLTIITIFCFSFVLMQTPVKPQKQHASTDQTNNLASSNGVSPLPVSDPTHMDTLSTISLPISSSASTASPQGAQMSQALQGSRGNSGSSNGRSSLKVDVVNQINKF